MTCVGSVICMADMDKLEDFPISHCASDIILNEKKNKKF